MREQIFRVLLHKSKSILGYNSLTKISPQTWRYKMVVLMMLELEYNPNRSTVRDHSHSFSTYAKFAKK